MIFQLNVVFPTHRTVDWNDVAVITVLYQLFLGTRNSKENIKPELRRAPACTRLRLKLFTYLIRSREASMHFPACIQVIFPSFFQKKLKFYFIFCFRCS
jgi:proteasome component ECM29